MNDSDFRKLPTLWDACWARTVRNEPNNSFWSSHVSFPSPSTSSSAMIACGNLKVQQPTPWSGVGVTQWAQARIIPDSAQKR